MMTARALAPLMLAVATALATGAAGQSAPPAAAAPPASASPAPGGAASPHRVAADSLVSIEIAEPLSSKTLKRGDMFAIRLAQPIMLDGAVLVPAGVAGQGQVVDAGGSGMLGKPAKLVLAARYLDWNGQRIPLHAFRWGEAGVDRTGAVFAVSMVPYAGVLSIFIRGGDIEIPVGAHALAKLGADVAPPATP